MSDSFAQGLRVLLPLSAQMLGWRPQEFWRATPQELVSALAQPAQDPTEAITRDVIRTIMERENHG